MSFLNPLFWFGLAAVAAPILVHLVRRTRARRVQFPALVFIRQVPQRTIRRRTLQNVLLLLLRCLAILLIVLAFTRPFFTGSNSAGATKASGATVILIDSSLSMRRDLLFERARARANSTIDESPGNESLAIVAFGKTYEVINPFSTDRNRARTAVNALTPGWDGTDYEQALRGGESLLTEIKTAGPKRLVLISDFQASGWNRAVATFKLSSNTQLKTFDVSDNTPAPNVALTNLEGKGVTYGQKYIENLAAHLSNFDDTVKDHLQVDFQINEQTVERREVSLNAQESKVLEFSNFNLNDGANRCTINVVSNDFTPDNHFYFTLRRAVPAKALIVEAAGRGRSDSLYLDSALTTNETLPFSFTLKSTGAVDPASIPEYKLLILNDAGPLSGPLIEAVTRFVESGGQLIIALGPHTDINTYNSEFKTISPAILREAVAPRSDQSVAITDVKFDHPIFDVFQESGRFASAHVYGYVRSEPSTNATVLARFEDGSPALIESQLNTGRVLLFTSTLGPGWNDLAVTSLYLPFVHQMVRYAGAREENSWYLLGQAFTVSKRDQAVAPAVDSPSGTRVNSARPTFNGDLLLTAREPGFYRLRYDKSPDFAAVDVDGKEGDFSKVNFPEFLASFTGGAGNSESGVLTRSAGADEVESRQKVWWSLLLAALILLLTESILSRRIKVAKMVG